MFEISAAIVTHATGVVVGGADGFGQGLGMDQDPRPSRSQKDRHPPTFQHDHLDLTRSAQDIAKELKSQCVQGAENTC